MTSTTDLPSLLNPAQLDAVRHAEGPLLVLAGAGSSAFASDFVVTKTADTVSGACAADCSLRDAIIAANPDKVAQAKAKPAVIGWFVGQVMKASAGKANPGAVNELLKRKLEL